MRDLGGRETARSDLVLFAGCIILALLALALPRPWAASLTATIRETALRPVVAVQSRAVSERTSRQGLKVLEHSRDSLALPGTMALPSFPPFISEANVSRLNSPSGSSLPWQSMHRSWKIGAIFAA